MSAKKQLDVLEIENKNIKEIFNDKKLDHIYEKNKVMINSMNYAQKKLLKYEIHNILANNAEQTEKELNLTKKIKEIHNLKESEIQNRTQKLLNNLKLNLNNTELKEYKERKEKEIEDIFKKKIWGIPFVGWFLLSAFSWVEEAKKAEKNPEKYDWWEKLKNPFLGMIWWAFLSMFWWSIYSSYKNDLKNIDLWKLPSTSNFEIKKGNNWENVYVAKEKVKNKVDEVKEWVKSKKEKAIETIEKIETKKSWYSKIGFGIIHQYTHIDFPEESWKHEIFSALNKYSYSKLFTLYHSYNPNKEFDKNNAILNNPNLKKRKSETIYMVLRTLFHPYSNMLYQSRLSPKSLRDILFDKWTDNLNKSIINIFKTEKERKDINKITKSLNKYEEWSTFEFKDISFETISILISLSFKSYATAWMMSLWNIKDKIYLYMPSWSDLFWWIKTEFENKRKNLISDNVINVIKWEWSVSEFWWSDKVKFSKKNLLKSYNSNLDTKENEELDKFLTFKDKLISTVKNKYNLWIDSNEFNNSFDSWLNLWKILYLYVALNWKDINTIDEFDKIHLLLWINWVLSKEKSTENDVSAVYMKKIIEEASNDSSEFFSENEKIILELITYKFLKTHENWITKRLTDVKSVVDSIIEDLLPNSLDPAVKKFLANWIEWLTIWALIAYIVAGKKAFWVKLLIATSWMAGYFVLIALSKWVLTKLESKFNKEEVAYYKKQVEKMLSDSPVSLTIKWKDKKDVEVTISWTKQMKKLIELWPDEYKNFSEKVEAIKLSDEWELVIWKKEEISKINNDNISIEKSEKDWVVIKYKWETYHFDIWIERFDYDYFDEKENFKWITDINMNSTWIKIDLKNELITIWNSTKTIDIKLKKIFEIIKNNTPKIAKHWIKDEIKYFVIEKGNNWNDLILTNSTTSLKSDITHLLNEAAKWIWKLIETVKWLFN